MITESLPRSRHRVGYGSIIPGFRAEDKFVITDPRPEGFKNGEMQAMSLLLTPDGKVKLTGGHTVARESIREVLGKLRARDMLIAISRGMKDVGLDVIPENVLTYLDKAKHKRPVRMSFPKKVAPSATDL